MIDILKECGIAGTADLNELIPCQNAELRNGFLMLCTQGEMQIELNDCPQTVAANQILFCLPQFTIGNYSLSDDFRMEALLIRLDAIEDVFYSCLRLEKDWYSKITYLSSHPVLCTSERQRRIGTLFAELVHLFVEGPDDSYRKHICQSFTQAFVFELLAWVEEEMQKSEVVAETDLSMKQDLHFQKFLSLLQQQKGRCREVAWYADQINITPKYLAAVCKKTSGRSPLDFINEVTIREAKQLLLTSSDSVKQVAFDMNFPNASMFCKYFRLHTGTSPLHYREDNR